LNGNLKKVSSETIN